MNEYKYSDIYVGMKDSFKVRITDDMMQWFEKNIGDRSPIHVDCQYAKEKGFDGNVVYGMLTTAFLSRFSGDCIPGKYGLCQSISVKYARPVYVGDTLQVVGEVVEMNDTVKQIVIRMYMTNENDEKVLRGSLVCGVLDE